jgi:hypothetical protein
MAKALVAVRLNASGKVTSSVAACGRTKMEKHSWLWWLSGKAKDADDIQVNNARQQTDQRMRPQDAHASHRHEAESKIDAPGV